MDRLLTANHVAWKIGVPLDELKVVANTIDFRYTEWSQTNEETGKIRHFCNPEGRLKHIQRLINQNLLNRVCLSSVPHGGVKKLSPKTNALQHAGSSQVVTLDVRDFFPSVSNLRVAQMYRRVFGCGIDAAWLLTRLTTYKRQLPQGAPTSTMVANLLLVGTVDEQIASKAAALGVSVTRFVDDYAFSGPDSHVLIDDTARALSRLGLRTWRKRSKRRIMSSSRPQFVTGLNVNAGNRTSVPRKRRDKVRAAIHQLRYLPSQDRRRAVLSIRSRIAHISQHNPGVAKRFSTKLDATVRDLNLNQNNKKL